MMYDVWNRRVIGAMLVEVSKEVVILSVSPEELIARCVLKE